MGMTIDEVIKELEWALANNTIEDVESAFKYISAIHIAIDVMRKYQKFQDQALSLYMERLKADMVAMLEEIDLEMSEQSFGIQTESWEVVEKLRKEIIQQKIQALEGKTDGEK